MKAIESSSGVIHAAEDLVLLRLDDLAPLVPLAASNPKRRARFCAHRVSSDVLHEMFIVLERDSYVRPHKHVGKAESFAVLEGEADLVMFDEDGTLRQVVPLGPPGGGRIFYYRLANPLYHTFVIHSSRLLFHEVTSGPFRREDTLFAPWAPDETSQGAVALFRTKLGAALSARKAAL